MSDLTICRVLQSRARSKKPYEIGFPAEESKHATMRDWSRYRIKSMLFEAAVSASHAPLQWGRLSMEECLKPDRGGGEEWIRIPGFA